MAKKYYVVWNGYHTGIFDNWEDCKEQVTGYPEARYKAYSDLEDATEAYRRGAPDANADILRSIATHKPAEFNYDAFPEIDLRAIAVDAACSGNPGPVEYRGVLVATGHELFRVGPLEGGTNNIGEYLALIHALASLDRQGRHDVTIYSDSVTAQAWVRTGIVKTTILRNPSNSRLMDILDRAKKWRATHLPSNPIRKWKTELWGEIPADFGRK